MEIDSSVPLKGSPARKKSNIKVCINVSPPLCKKVYHQVIKIKVASYQICRTIILLMAMDACCIQIK